MILEASQRGGAGKLAKHLLNAQENDHVSVHEILGFLSDDIAGALGEIEAIARGTKCRQYMFSVSLNPPYGAEADDAAFKDAIAKIEESLNLKGQPRVIVFYEKKAAVTRIASGRALIQRP